MATYPRAFGSIQNEFVAYHKDLLFNPDNPLGTIQCDFIVSVRPEPFGFAQESPVEGLVLTGLVVRRAHHERPNGLSGFKDVNLFTDNVLDYLAWFNTRAASLLIRHGEVLTPFGLSFVEAHSPFDKALLSLSKGSRRTDFKHNLAGSIGSWVNLALLVLENYRQCNMYWRKLSSIAVRPCIIRIQLKRLPTLARLWLLYLTLMDAHYLNGKRQSSK